LLSEEEGCGLTVALSVDVNDLIVEIGRLLLKLDLRLITGTFLPLMIVFVREIFESNEKTER